MRKGSIRVKGILLGMLFLTLLISRQGLTAAGVPGNTPDKDDMQTLKAVDKDGLPVPDDYTEYSAESSAYIQSITASSPSPLKTVLEFYRKELKALKWRELPAKPGKTEGRVLLTYENDKKDGLVVQLIRDADGKTGISLNVRKDAEAKAAGVVAPPGKARVYLGNMNDGPVVFMLNHKKYDVKAQSTNDKSMKDVPFVDLNPGKHAFTLTLPGKPPVKDTFDIGADETWGLIAGPGGAMPVRLY